MSELRERVEAITEVQLCLREIGDRIHHHNASLWCEALWERLQPDGDLGSILLAALDAEKSGGNRMDKLTLDGILAFLDDVQTAIERRSIKVLDDYTLGHIEKMRAQVWEALHGEPDKVLAEGWLCGIEYGDDEWDSPQAIHHATFSRKRPGWAGEKYVCIYERGKGDDRGG